MGKKRFNYKREKRSFEYEYNLTCSTPKIDYRNRDIEVYLDNLGEKGWEIISYDEKHECHSFSWGSRSITRISIFAKLEYNY